MWRLIAIFINEVHVYPVDAASDQGMDALIYATGIHTDRRP